jgi:Ca-activated chloride channel family protein
MKTTVLLDHEPVADGGYYVRALLRIEGDPPEDEHRVPLNLSLVLDRSGSMAGPPLAAAIEAARTLVRRLRVEDTVSVVAYDGTVRVVAPPATGEAQEDLADRLGGIEPGGSTNLSGGWLRGRDLVAENLRDGGVNRVVLLTDGLANRGITDRASLVDLAGSAIRSGISTTTIGFGPHFDEDLLRAMADAGRGGAYYVEQVDQAAGIFEEELAGLLSLAAQNVRVAVEAGADAEFIKVAHAYPSHAEDGVLTVELGDLYAREPRRLLMEFLIGPGVASGTEAHVVDLTVTAHVLVEPGQVELHTITLPVTLSPEEGGKVDATVRREALLLRAAEAREEALQARDRGDYEGGAATLRESLAALEPMAAHDEQLAEELRDLEQVAGLFDAQHVAASDVKYMKQRSHSTHRSRDSERERYRRTGGEDGRA